MRRLALFVLGLAAALAAHALPANVEFVEALGGISQYRLKSNGMPILLHRNAASPVVTFMVVYHVGSRNEAPGNTGSAHLLEHMIFNKSTQNFGRANGHKTFQEVLYEVGADAGSSNMTTWYDRMNGYSTVPRDKLSMAMKIEADRLGRGLILDSERQSEMSVVRNEYEIGENNPQRALLQALVGTAIVAHPYHWSTIGYRADIEGVTTEKLREHYKTFFHPDNAQAILVGDFDPEEALATFDREFGGFPKAPKPIPQVITVEPPQEGERRTMLRRPGTVGLVMVGYTRPGVSHPDFNPLEVLANVLSEGVNSRLYKALVETRIATSVGALNFSLRDPYPFIAHATLAPGKTHEEAERAIKAVLADVAANGITAEELARAQRQIEVADIRTRDGTYNYAQNLGEVVASAHWKRFVTFVDDIRAVTADDVKRVAGRYLVPDRATVAWYVPLPPDSKKPETLALGPPVGVGATSATAAAASTQAPAPGAAPPAAKSATGATSIPFAQRTVRKVLANGVIVDVVRNAASPTVAVRGLVRGGEASAPADSPAIAALLARMLPRGTTKRPKEEIGKRLDGAGATRAYVMGLGETTITAAGLAKDLPLLVEVLAEELQHPAFDATELDKARQELENAYLRADDDTQARAMEKLSQLVFPATHPYYAPGREKRVANVRAITAQALRDFHRERMTGSNLVLAIVGDVDPAQAVALVEKAFAGLARGTRFDPSSLPRVAVTGPGVRENVKLPGKANMNLVMGAASGLRRGDPDFEAALVANAVLGQTALTSRIGKRVRDTEGLTYQVYSRFGSSEELDGYWFVNVNIAPQNLAKALASTKDVIDQFAREGATAGEVEVQKSFFAGNYQVNLNSNGGIAAALAAAERYGYGPSYLDEFPKRIRAVTPAQANAAMKKHFAADRLNTIVSGDVQ